MEDRGLLNSDLTLFLHLIYTEGPLQHSLVLKNQTNIPKIHLRIGNGIQEGITPSGSSNDFVRSFLIVWEYIRLLSWTEST